MLEGPDAEEHDADHPVQRHTADGGVPGIGGGGAVVPHDEPLVFRHLVGELDIAVSQGLFVHPLDKNGGPWYYNTNLPVR